MLRSLIAGFLSGLRSLTPITVMAWHGQARGGESRLPLLHSRKVRYGLLLLAGLELVGDKLPFAPARTEATGLSGRLFTGGVLAAALSSQGRKGRLLSGVLGMVGAFAGAHVGYRVRKELVAQLDTSGVQRPVPPRLSIALLEDALTVGGSLALVRPKVSRTSDSSFVVRH